MFMTDSHYILQTSKADGRPYRVVSENSASATVSFSVRLRVPYLLELSSTACQRPHNVLEKLSGHFTLVSRQFIRSKLSLSGCLRSVVEFRWY